MTNEKWHGRTRAFTMSFDDGVTQDRRVVEIINKYGLKATFHLNSGMLDGPGWIDDGGVSHDKISAKEVAGLYAGHEVACHTVTHPDLTKLSPDEIVAEIEDDRRALEDLVGYEVIGMAYPGGCVNDELVRIIKERTGVKYSRTVNFNHSFAPQTDLIRFDPTVHYMRFDKLDELTERFLAGEEGLFYFFAHAYEFDHLGKTWDRFEDFCRRISGHDDIYYCTNKEAFFGK